MRKEYAPGDVIGEKYGLVRLLGEGGMGSVWVAENMALKANVALKLIRADVAEASANERFLSEARLAARLQHAAIVRVFDFGKTEHDEPFIVMELLEGETLGQRLSRLGAIDPTELCQTLLPIIDALHSAHGHGVIHRDLKPDNVFIAKADGGGIQPKLLDFGIAKLRGESAFQSTKLTQAGTLIGSPDYMSPEQARGETDLDPRSDVWAVCVLAYECLVGKPPFHGDNYNALLWAIIHDEPVPITVFQAGDAELWRILKKGFAKDRNGRWESARKLGEAIAMWLESRGVLEDVCNRSLQASWLPAERPTRPELAPFDPLGPVPLVRGMRHELAAPAPTLTAIRRPHAMSLWFAGLGLLTLLGAVLLNETGASLPGLEAGGSGVQQVDPLRPHRSVPGPLPETLADPARRELRTTPVPARPVPGAAAPSTGSARSPALGVPPAATRPPSVAPSAAAAREPATGPGSNAATQPSSWKDGNVRSLRERDEALAEEFRNGVTGSRGEASRSTPKRAAPRNTTPARAKAPAKAPAATRAKPPRAAPRKTAPAPEPLAEPEIDFGI